MFFPEMNFKKNFSGYWFLGVWLKKYGKWLVRPLPLLAMSAGS
uniref:Uncharacterized protein n=1 Tax=Nelumbo nucifera TaxID=4432 RepID=A0A822ZYW8_NELNU|nr:TPA_asm: hypothetical protein HUJ06_018492 [Nelumbo nucifera]